MLVVKVELWPGGDEARAREIARAEIANVSGLADVSDYGYVMRTSLPHPLKAMGKILGHNRRHSVWLLIRGMIDDGIDRQ